MIERVTLPMPSLSLQLGANAARRNLNIAALPGFFPQNFLNMTRKHSSHHSGTCATKFEMTPGPRAFALPKYTVCVSITGLLLTGTTKVRQEAKWLPAYLFRNDPYTSFHIRKPVHAAYHRAPLLTLATRLLTPRFETALEMRPPFLTSDQVS